MPAHAWLVHAPLGLSLGVPFVLFACAWLARQRPAAWWLAVAATTALAVAAVVASNAGEDEALRLRNEPRVAVAIHTHEDAADLFTWTACALAGLTLVASALKKDKARLVATFACAVLSLSLLPLGWNAGHAGGTLVWSFDVPAVRPRN
jgi:uncharacterized membrane protein